MTTPNIIPIDAIRAVAAGLVSEGPESFQLRCSHCAREVDTYAHAYDDTADVLREFIEHTAFDHNGRAAILKVELTRFAIVAERVR